MIDVIIQDPLNFEEKKYLLQIARYTLNAHFGLMALEDLPDFDSPKFKEQGASFVTLTINNELRGCVGALEPYQPLIDDVREHALAAAFHDYRFSPLTVEELNLVKIEISRLTRPVPLYYNYPGELLALIKPMMDGIIINYKGRRATFLPQVWEKLPDPAQFLDHLCLKMGTDSGLWRQKKMDVYTYHVEEFQED